jgi:hypothetical protein
MLFRFGLQKKELEAELAELPPGAAVPTRRIRSGFPFMKLLALLNMLSDALQSWNVDCVIGANLAAGLLRRSGFFVGSGIMLPLHTCWISSGRQKQTKLLLVAGRNRTSQRK